MKYFVLAMFINLLFISGCLIYTQPREAYFTGLNFYPFIEEGFFITPNQYEGESEPIGYYKVKLEPAIVKKGLVRDSTAGRWLTRRSDVVDIEVVTAQEALDSLVTISREKGANALSQVVFTYETERIFNYDVTSAVVSGFAIRIKK
jgi:uncharacterized protein YbjQ (UPF0145 family)